MAIFQPSNVIPSSFAGVGLGTVDATDNVQISWQVNGNSPMTAFQIQIYNNTNNLLVKDTGIINTGIPSGGFYGTDNKGNPQQFIFSPTDTDGNLYTWNNNAWATTTNGGISNGNEYKIIITQYWGTPNEGVYPNSITQYSGSVFLTRATPLLNITLNNAVFDGSVDVDSAIVTFSASYSQAQGDVVNSIRWQFGIYDGNQKPTTTITDENVEILDDTGFINTSIFDYTYNGIQPTNSNNNTNVYVVKCTIETQNGVQKSTDWVAFLVNYNQAITSSGITAECMDDDSILVSWDKAIDIPGVLTPEGNPTIKNGLLELNAIQSVEWETINDQPLSLSSPFSIYYKSKLNIDFTSSIANETENVSLTAKPFVGEESFIPRQLSRVNWCVSSWNYYYGPQTNDDKIMDVAVESRQNGFYILMKKRLYLFNVNTNLFIPLIDEFSYECLSIAIGNNVNVILAKGGYTYVSTDGFNSYSIYDNIASEIGRNVNKIKYVNNRFFVVGNSNSANNIAFSLDGITWTRVSSSSGNFIGIDYGLINGELRYVAVTNNGKIMVSVDGITWSQYEHTVDVPNGEWVDIKYENGSWIFISNNEHYYVGESLPFTTNDIFSDDDIIGICKGSYSDGYRLSCITYSSFNRTTNCYTSLGRYFNQERQFNAQIIINDFIPQKYIQLRPQNSELRTHIVGVQISNGQYYLTVITTKSTTNVYLYEYTPNYLIKNIEPSQYVLNFTQNPSNYNTEIYITAPPVIYNVTYYSLTSTASENYEFDLGEIKSISVNNIAPLNTSVDVIIDYSKTSYTINVKTPTVNTTSEEIEVNADIEIVYEPKNWSAVYEQNDLIETNQLTLSIEETLVDEIARFGIKIVDLNDNVILQPNKFLLPQKIKQSTVDFQLLLNPQILICNILNVDKTYLLNYSQNSLSKIKILGPQVVDYLYIQQGEITSIENFTPSWTADTLFYANFSNMQDALQAGTLSVGGEILNSLYRVDSQGKLTFIDNLPTSITEFKDYSTKSGESYAYELFYLSVNSGYSTPVLSNSVCRRFKAYTLIEATQDINRANLYHVVKSWRFGNNISAGSVSNNNTPNWLTNFTPYRLKQPSSRLGKSGTLQALLSNYNQSENFYEDTTKMMDRLYQASASNNTFFLKDMKGNLYMVGISAPIVQTIEIKTKLQQVKVSIPWEEVGDASNVSLIQLPTDEGYSQDEVFDVIFNVDILTGMLSLTYPNNYKGTTFELQNNNLIATTPNGINGAKFTLLDGQVIATESEN